VLYSSYLATCLVALLGVGALTAQEKSAAQLFAPGEIIVKFSGKSEGGQISARAIAEGTPSDAALTSYIQVLSKEVGVPLEVKQLGSGGSLVVAVRRPELIAILLKRLRETTDVKETRVVSGNDPTAPAVEVDFVQGSPETEVLAQESSETGAPGPQAQAITERLKHACGLALTSRIVSRSQIVVTPDLRALTLDLAARLSKRTDVEYAQPNFIRRPTGSAGQLGPSK
jgi:hypothetical protein